MGKTFVCEVRNLDKGEYVIEFMDGYLGEILELKKECCLDNCLIDLYEFEKSCYDKYCTPNSDNVIMRIKDVMFGL